MFSPEPWARAFLRAKTAEESESAFEILKLYCRAALAIPGEVAGFNDARRFAVIIDRALEKTVPDMPDAAAYARNFFLLMIRKGCLYHYKKIVARIRKIMDENRGTVQAVLEAPFEPDAAFTDLVKQRLLAKTKARQIELGFRLSPELIGGFRIRMGSLLLDGSLEARLAKMASDFGGENCCCNRSIHGAVQ
jgi:F0F1-type ATP synthase delta subunit